MQRQPPGGMLARAGRGKRRPPGGTHEQAHGILGRADDDRGGHGTGPIPADAATFTYQFNWRGKYAEAEYFDLSGCIFTNAYVLAVDGRIKISGLSVQPDRFVYAYVTQYDTCNELYVVYRDGYTWIDPRSRSTVISQLHISA